MRVVVGVGLMVNMLGSGWCRRWGIGLGISIASLMRMLLKLQGLGDWRWRSDFPTPRA
jgi:hypothetical protein